MWTRSSRDRRGTAGGCVRRRLALPAGARVRAGQRHPTAGLRLPRPVRRQHQPASSTSRSTPSRGTARGWPAWWPAAWSARRGGLSADDFSDALAACGAELEASASPDGFSVQLSVPVSQLARGLDLMAMAVAEPSYAAKEFEQEKRLRLQEIEHTQGLSRAR